MSNDLLEIELHGRWLKVGEWVFRSWTGPRRKNGITYNGPVYYLGTDNVYTRRHKETIK